jgi:coproporphyrinogen III oxidase
MTNCERRAASGRAFLGMLLALLVSTATPAADEAAAPAAALTPEQQALADRMQAFQDATEKSFFERVKYYNRTLDIEERVFDYDTATHTVKVTRGKVVEKAGWYVNVQKKGMPPMVPDPLYSRYMEVDAHPATPHVGMLHATIYFTYLRNGAGMLAGYMDYVPGVWHEEDNQRLKQAVEAVFARHGEDIGRFRKELCDSKFGAEHHRDRLKAACAGVSLYAPPMLKVTAANLDLVTGAFRAITEEYFAILDERRRQRVTSADRIAQDAMRKRWLEDQVFADTFSRKVVPYEVWSLANLPPTVRF